MVAEGRRVTDKLIALLLGIIAALLTVVTVISVEFTRDVRTIMASHEQRLGTAEGNIKVLQEDLHIGEGNATTKRKKELR